MAHNISDLKSERQNVEAAILHILTKFEVEYGVSVVDVSINHAQALGEVSPIVIGCNLSISI